MSRLFSESRLHAWRSALHQRVVRGSVSGAVFEFIAFGIKQGWACLFGGLMLALLLAAFLFWPDEAVLKRYDAITLGAVVIQLAMLAFKLESWDEARVILVFHMVGTAMEVFKVNAGSWVYPDSEGVLFQIAGVPLFSGFMYAAVGSYLARVWRIMAFRFDRFPPLWLQALLAVAAYVNFFTHHFVFDIRNLLFIASLVIYGPCIVWFRPDERHRPMPLVLVLVLVALFIWFAENIGTYARAWTYPGQETLWQPVSLAKLGSWYLLMLISFVLAASVQNRTSTPVR